MEREVIELFEFRDPLLRYTLSFGISVHDAEEVVQEVFLSLFRHLQLRRSRKNRRGWIFRVAHNRALKQLYANQRVHARMTSEWTIAKQQFDPTPDPEDRGFGNSGQAFDCATDSLRESAASLRMTTS
ncbi:MAG: sigma factor [Candidatus Sulfotelmatobacter sp.]